VPVRRHLAAGYRNVLYGEAQASAGERSSFSTIGGGQQNWLYGKWAAIAGGYKNRTLGDYAFVAGATAIGPTRALSRPVRGPML
jgi:hypothetical protein